MRALVVSSLVLGSLLACGPAPIPKPSASQPSAQTSPPAPPATTLRYSILMMDRVAGKSVTTIAANGERTTHHEYNDRGRGPSVDTRASLAADGTMASLDTRGVDYMKSPVEERFRSDGGKLSWKSSGEQGETPAKKGFYVPMEWVPDTEGVLVSALLRAPGHVLPLLPEGEARLERAAELTIEAGDKRVHVTQFEITGFGFSPSSVWMDDDGALFASASTWSSVVREGFEGAVPKLIEAQLARAGQRQEKLARALTHTPPGPDATLAITHARLFDAKTKATRPDTTVIVAGGRIRAVGPSATTKVPAGAEVLDAQGKALLPGLWDMHVHLHGSDGLLHIASGVTSTRDLDNDTDALLAKKKRYDEGAEVGPRIFMAGFIDGRGPFSGPTKVFGDTEAEARAAVVKYASLGYEQIKIYSSIKPEIVPAIVAEAHARGLRVSGHVPAHMLAEDAVNAGFDEIQHMNFVFLNFVGDRELDTRTPLRFSRVAEKAAGLDLQSPAVQAFVRLLQTKKTVIDPTLTAMENLLVNRAGQIAPSFAMIADRLPVQVRRDFRTGGIPVPAGMDGTFRASFAAMLAMTSLLHRSGVTLVAGTDDLAGFSLHRELELYAMAGISAPDVLQLATLGAARVMKHDKELGSIEEGKLADLILVDGDPVLRITDIRKVHTVVKAGAIFRSAEVYAALGISP